MNTYLPLNKLKGGAKLLFGFALLFFAAAIVSARGQRVDDFNANVNNRIDSIGYLTGGNFSMAGDKPIPSAFVQ